jgi:hypothetical protein
MVVSSQIEEILLSSNQISGRVTFSEYFKSLKVLKLLYFENNFFGTLPDSICDLAILKS